MKNLGIFLMLIGLIFLELEIITINDNNKKDKINDLLLISKLSFQKDSIVSYYQDISNCIKEDFNIDSSGKIKFKKLKIQ